jgi:uncharacterized protein (DUF2062 family)
MRSILRRLPSRARVAKIPIVGRLMARARQSNFLWSFRREEVAPAFLLGWVLTLTPFLGFHPILIVLFTFLFRANLLIGIALEFLHTPLTAPFLWPALHSIGGISVRLLGNDSAIAALELHHVLSPHGIALITLGALWAGYALALVSIAAYGLLLRKKNS